MSDPYEGSTLSRCDCGGYIHRDPVDGFEVCDRCGVAQ